MFSRFFIDRPIFSTVLSVVIVVLGLVSMVLLPIAQYPEIAPPTITVTTTYPGASAKVVADTVANPIEQEVNGVEGMLYMSSRCTNDGQMTLDVTFRLGVDLDMAQVLVQNRVAIAQARLPEEVRRQGITTKKKSPNILLAVNLVSPDNSRDALFLSNYATTQVKDALARVEGVGDVTMLGARDYSMRIWLDPERLAARSLTAGDVTAALREQNVQVAAGRLGQPPTETGLDFQYPLNTLGRLLEPDQFGQIIVKMGEKGEVVRLEEVARIELGAKNYDVASYLDGRPAITLAVFPLPGANAIATADAVKEQMRELFAQSVSGVEYRIVYDTTVFIDESIHEVYKTLFEAFLLVFLVVLVFLQDWRATILPMIDVPVALIGTLAVMALLGFSINNLTLFGLVLAIGIVVDDAIVVIENVERWLAKGIEVREATAKAMDEITPAIIAITLVLASVFVPTAFMAGISGQFYRQFALTIAASMGISAINAMTMTPSRAVQIFRTAHSGGHVKKEALPPWGVAVLVGLLFYWRLEGPARAALERAGLDPAIAGWSAAVATGAVGLAVGWLFRGILLGVVRVLLEEFNRLFDRFALRYGQAIGGVLRFSALAILAYAALLLASYVVFVRTPVGFIPDQDKGYLVVNAQLPDGASLERTEAVARRIIDIASKTEGVAHTLALPGYSILTSSNLSNMMGMFVVLEGFEERRGHPERRGEAILRELRRQFAAIQEAQVVVFGAPPVDGIGSTGGFKLQVQDRRDAGFDALEGAVDNLVEKGNLQPGFVGLYSSFRANQPQLYVDIDRTKAKAMKVPLDDVFEALQTFLGSNYVNDFTRFGRNWQVNVQADMDFRTRIQDVGRIKVRNLDGRMVPLGTLLTIRDDTGPAIVNHYNMYPSAEISGGVRPGTSSGQAIALMDEIARREAPIGFTTAWTELSLQQILASQDLITKLVFPLGVVFVFLVLSAKYESWSMPIAIILIVPMCILPALLGVQWAGLDNNIFTQIGLLVLVALAAKNAILVVEFARQLEDEGTPRFEAVVEASRLRLRPILMTSFAFILGVLPLVRATGAGAEMRFSLGVAVVSGMIGVTFFGLVFTPIFYTVVMRAAEGFGRTRPPLPSANDAPAPSDAGTGAPPQGRPRPG